MLDRAAAVFAAAEGDWRVEQAYVQHNRGRVLRELDRLAEAEAASRAAVALWEVLQGPDGAETLHSRAGLGRILLRGGHAEQARQLFDTVLQRSLATLPAQHPRLADRHLELAEALAALGLHDAARQHYDAALDIATAVMDPVQDSLLQIRLGLAESLLQQNHATAAREQVKLAGPALAARAPGSALRQRAERLEATLAR